MLNIKIPTKVAQSFHLACQGGGSPPLPPVSYLAASALAVSCHWGVDTCSRIIAK